MKQKLFFTHLSKLGFCCLLGMGLLFVVASGYAQSSKTQQAARQSISGIIRDTLNNPISAASIFVKGTNSGVRSADDGSFTLQASPNAILVVTSIGYKSFEVNLNGRTHLDVQLVGALDVLNEVVVTGYQTISKDQATGTYQTLSGPVLQQRPTPNFLDKLEGMAAGVAVSTNEYGISKIEIRGRNSLKVNETPLYVVDGFPINGTIGVGPTSLLSYNDNASALTINPEDIESINILSDAAATAQWGVRASNGVVVITTKRAKAGKTKVDFSTFYAVDEKIDFSKNRWMTTAQEVDLEQETIDKKWYNFSSMIAARNPLSQVQLANVYRQGLAPNGEAWTEQTFQNYISALRTYNAAQQWQDMMYRNAGRLTTNLSLSSNAGKNSVYASLSFNDNKAKEVGNDQQRIIFYIGDEFKATKRLTFRANMNAMQMKGTNNMFPAGQVEYERSYNRLVDEYGNRVQYYTTYDPFTSRSKEAISGFFPYGYNALDQRENSDNNTSSLNLRAQFAIEYEIIKGLQLQTQFQYEQGKSGYDRYFSMDLPAQRIKVNNLYIADDPNKGYQIPVGSQYDFARADMNAFNWRNNLSFNRKFGLHDVSLLAGFSMQKVENTYLYDRVYGYNKETLTSVPVNQKDFVGGKIFDWNGNRYYDNYFYTPSGNNTDDREIGFYVMPGYTFKNKYTINANYRVDQKNLFGSDPRFRYKPLWSVGGAWQLYKEDFISKITWIDRLTLKGSYGLTGNASNQYSPYAQARNSVSSWGANLYDYLTLSQPANDKLKWEETTAINVGLEFGLFKRLTGVISVYKETSNDLLGDRALDPTVGFTRATVNYASLENKGIELTLGADIIRRKNFTWNASFNISYNNNKVTDIEDLLISPLTLMSSGGVQKGKPISNIYSTNYAGVSQYGEVQLYDKDGKIKSWRSNINSADELIYWGNTVAPYYGGFSTSINAFGFDLSVNTVFKFGHYYRHFVQQGYYATFGYRMTDVWADRWRQPGDENSTRVPKIAYEGKNPVSGITESRYDNTDADRFFTNSQDFIEKADFLKVRDIILGYNFPSQWLNRIHMSSLRLSVQATNPFAWFANPYGEDPENPARTNYTNLRSITFGLRTSF